MSDEPDDLLALLNSVSTRKRSRIRVKDNVGEGAEELGHDAASPSLGHGLARFKRAIRQARRQWCVRMKGELLKRYGQMPVQPIEFAGRDVAEFRAECDRLLPSFSQAVTQLARRFGATSEVWCRSSAETAVDAAVSRSACHCVPLRARIFCTRLDTMLECFPSVVASYSHTSAWATEIVGMEDCLMGARHRPIDISSVLRYLRLYLRVAGIVAVVDLEISRLRHACGGDSDCLMFCEFARGRSMTILFRSIANDASGLLSDIEEWEETYGEDVAACVSMTHADMGGRTCLHWAAWHGNQQMVSLLLGQRASLTTPDKSFDLPFAAAVLKRHYEVALSLLDPLVRRPAFRPHHLPRAVVERNTHWLNVALAEAPRNQPQITQVVQRLAQVGASINGRFTGGCTRLMRACSSGCRAEVQVLIKASADVTLANDSGQSVVELALHLAVERDEEVSIPILEALLSGKADPNGEMSDRRDHFLHFSCSQGFVGVTEVLLNAKADIRLWNADKKCPVHLAAAAGHRMTVFALSVVGRPECEVALEDGEGLQAMDLCSERRSRDLLERLGATHSLFYAVKTGNLQLVAQLMAQKADPCEANSAGNCVLDLPEARKGRMESVLLVDAFTAT
mmetsp:Transcript_110682/g.253552  ORF Transcript_110682/g.253552 Transcript_110682/m.253552 type:complete len:624 (+) Transcript_110682:75-1946(+)